MYIAYRAKSRGYTKHKLPAPARPPEAMLMAKNLAKSSFGLACQRKRPASCAFPREGGGDGEEQETRSEKLR